MSKLDVEDMDFNELWLLHEELTRVLAKKISAEKNELERRLARLSFGEPVGEVANSQEAQPVERPRRKYPKVLPKYFNPSAPQETWSGRGKQPRWVDEALRSGHSLEDLQIPANKVNRGRRGRRS